MRTVTAAASWIAGRRRLSTILLLLLATAGRAAGAEDSHAPMFAFHGYGTLGLVHSSEDQADFLGGLLIENGAGHSEDWSAQVDSRLGAQLTATFNSRLSAIVQLVVEQQVDGTYTPQLDWANVKYQLTPDASIRLGRIVLPTFMVSDYRKVGYANAWVRPPVEVYGLIPITTSDGVDASYRIVAGDFTNTIQANYGRSDVKLPADGTAKARDVWGLTGLAERGAATVHVSYQQAKLWVDSYNTLFDAFRQFGPEGIAIADRFDADGGIVQFLGVGAAYDPGKWFVTAEWGSTEMDSAVGARRGWYVSGGYRFGEFTPYLTYAEVDADKISDPGLTVSAYPPPIAGLAAGLNAALSIILAPKSVQNTISIGARWDFVKNFDLKLQFDHSQVGRGSPGTLGNIQPGFKPGGSYDLISVAVDFVF